MNVLFVAPNYYPHIGGVEKHIRELSAEIAKDGHRITILVVKYDAVYPDHEQQGNIEIFRFKKPRIKIISDIRLRWDVLRSFWHFIRADVIHYHDFSTFWDFGIWLYPLFKLFRKKVFLTFHGYEGDIPPRPSVVLKRKICQKLVDANICVGHFIEKWYGTKADIVIYGGVHQPQGPVRLDNYALFIGRLAEDTGIRAYLAAWELISKNHPELRFVICGGGPLQAELEGIVRSRGIPGVEFKGFVLEPEYYIKKARVVFTSGYLAILEAFSFQKPVLSFYDNPLKKDYLEMLPNSQSMLWIGSTGEELSTFFDEALVDSSKVAVAHEFSLENSWTKVKRDYYRLWGMNDSGL
jgi:glycosyltransferase involved in cell wall biosynthesis